MVRLAAELLLLLGLLLLTLHITVLRSSDPEAPPGNHSQRQQVRARNEAVLYVKAKRLFRPLPAPPPTGPSFPLEPSRHRQKTPGVPLAKKHS